MTKIFKPTKLPNRIHDVIIGFIIFKAVTFTFELDINRKVDRYLFETYA